VETLALHRQRERSSARTLEDLMPDPPKQKPPPSMAVGALIMIAIAMITAVLAVVLWTCF
jgi:hypothetical protein